MNADNENAINRVTDRSRGWSADQVVRDRGDRPPGRTGWSGRQWVSDGAGHAGSRRDTAGWSSTQIVRDHLHHPAGDRGWSALQVVRDRPGRRTS